MSKDREREMALKRAEEHPFQPKVTKKGSTVREGDADGTRERLYKLAGERDMIRECTKYHMMEAEARTHTFKPHLNPDLPSNHIPIHLRANKVIADKQEKLNALRSSLQASPVSDQERIGEASNSALRVTDAAHQRLHSEAARQAEKSVALQSKYEDMEKEVNTFKPRLCPGSEGLVESYKNKPFLDRQKEREEKVEEKRIKIEEDAVKGYSDMFKPRLGKRNEEVLMKNRPEIVCEGAKERVERLSGKDAERIRGMKERICTEEYSKYDFRPRVNNISKALAPNGSSVEELVGNRRGVEKREKVKREQEERVREEV